MIPKWFVWLMVIIFSAIGSALPMMFGWDGLSFASIIGSGIGAIVGIWVAVKIGNWVGY